MKPQIMERRIPSFLILLGQRDACLLNIRVPCSSLRCPVVVSRLLT